MPKGIKLGGRQAGTPNKATKEARDKFKWLLDSYTPEEMKADFEALTPKEKLSFISDLAEFVIPKLSRQELTGKDGKDLQTSPLVFVSAEKLTDDQIKQIMDKDAGDNDESI